MLVHYSDAHPVPEGYIVLGRAGDFITNGEFFDGIIKPTARVAQGEWEWSSENERWMGTASGCYYAAPIDSEIVRLNVPPLPEEGLEIIGHGVSERQGRQEAWMLSLSRGHSEWDYGMWNCNSPNAIYARRIRTMEQDQTTAPAPIMANFRPQQHGDPEGSIVIGTISELRETGTFLGWVRGVGGRLISPDLRTLRGNDPSATYIIPINSPIIQQCFPAPPNGWEGFQIFGYGRDESMAPESCYVIARGDTSWTEWEGTTSSNWIVGAYTGLTTVRPVEAVRAVRQWDLMVGSEIIDPNNIAEAVSELVENQSMLPMLAEDLDEAMRRSDPEVSIEHWIDREPSLMAVIEFVPLASTGGVDIHEIAENETNISNVIIKAAAGVMLRGGLSDHFRYLEDGTLVIDPSAPPTLDQAYELLKRTLETKETASKLENYSAWMLGMIADQFEGFFQDRFDPSVIMEQTSRAYNTYICSLKTFRTWWNDRREGLTFTHHREVCYAKHLDHEKGCQVLDLSQKYKLTVLQQRKVISYARRFDLAALQTEMEEQGAEGVEDLMERIDIRSVNKRYIFFLRSTNRWYEYKGPFENIPNGASPIINADTRQIMAQDGTATKPNEWVPVGTETPTPTLDAVAEEAAEDEEDEEDES